MGHVQLPHTKELKQAVSYILMKTRCLKITEKVSFDIASEVSYVYILNGQKLPKLKMTKNGPFLASF